MSLDEATFVRADVGHDLVDRHLRPPVKAYGVSHHVQRRLHAASRTNTHGRPTCVDSPWIDR